ncbi:hypothetical protein, partial [Nocardia cyriacigeorgica]|uniref:hypothetical protein n=1 Tax=Nocardia cyriacigeorgica TaxID=135487 RepID=UPI002454364E
MVGKKEIKNLENKGNPWGQNAKDRLNWINELDFDIPVFGKDADSFVLELEGGMGRALTAPPGSVPEVGEVVSFARFSPPSINAPA